MDGAHKYATDGNYQKSDLTELDTENNADYGTDAGNVEKLNKHILPLRQRHAVYSVRRGDSRGRAIVGP